MEGDVVIGFLQGVCLWEAKVWSQQRDRHVAKTNLALELSLATIGAECLNLVE